MPIYELVASPSLYPGQRLEARVEVPEGCSPATVGLLMRVYDGAADAESPDILRDVLGPIHHVAPGTSDVLSWAVPDLDGQPATLVGIRSRPARTLTPKSSSSGCTGQASQPWSWAGRQEEGRCGAEPGWTRSDRFDAKWPEPFRLIQNEGFGQLVHGSRDSANYVVSADVTPHLAEAAGVAARVQGMTRGYVLELAGRTKVRLLRRYDGETELATAPFEWRYGTTYELRLEVDDGRLRGWVDDHLLVDVLDDDTRLRDGAAALTIRAGRTSTEPGHHLAVRSPSH